MADCDLGSHPTSIGTVTKLNWCCPDCLETFRKNHNEIVAWGEYTRELAEMHRAHRSPYRFLPYLALVLGFSAFLIAFFL